LPPDSYGWWCPAQAGRRRAIDCRPVVGNLATLSTTVAPGWPPRGMTATGTIVTRWTAQNPPHALGRLTRGGPSRPAGARLRGWPPETGGHSCRSPPRTRRTWLDSSRPSNRPRRVALGAPWTPTGCPAPSAWSPTPAPSRFRNRSRRPMALGASPGSLLLAAQQPSGRTPVLSIKAARRDGSAVRWADIAAGRQDTAIRAQAGGLQSLKRADLPVAAPRPG